MRRKIPVVLDLDEVERLKKAIRTRYLSGKRDKAIVVLTLNTGLRADEVINLKVSDVDLKNKAVILNKAKKDSFGVVVFNSDEVVETIKSWLSVRPKKSEWLFCTITKEKKIVGKGITRPGNKLSRQYLTSMVKRYAELAGIKKNVSFHTLRHTYATWLYIATKDIELVRQQLRHKSISTTTIYTQTALQFIGHKALLGFKL